MKLPNLLYVVHRFPGPPDKGDRIRAGNLIRFLSRRAILHVVCQTDEPVEESAWQSVRPFCERLEAVPVGRWKQVSGALGSLVLGASATEGAFRNPALASVIRSWALQTRFDACLASSSGVAGYLEAEELRGVPAIVDFVDVDSQKWLDYAAAARPPRSWLYRLEGCRLRRREAAISSWAKAVILVSESEAEVYRQFCPNGSVRVIGNGVDLDYFRPQPGPVGPACVFVGALDYRPNVLGAAWFCREVWPQVRREAPEARFYLVGRRPTTTVRRLGRLPGVEVIGGVPDVRPWLARAAAVVVPLSIGRGVQNKVLESLAMGKGTVVSPNAATGLQGSAGVHWLTARTAEEWKKAVLRLFGDEQRRDQLGAAGRKFVETHHRWETQLSPMGELIESVTSPFNRDPRGSASEIGGLQMHSPAVAVMRPEDNPS